MKKLLFGLCITFSLLSNAQNSVNLTIKLSPIQSLIVNPSNKDVLIHYQNRLDYKEGKGVICNDHLSVFSTGAFEIKAKSSQPNLTSNKGTIPVNDILVKAEKGSTPLNEATLLQINLNSSEQTLISSSKGSSDKNFTISYSAKGNDEYIDLYDQTNSNEFKTVVYYTINPK